MADAIEAVETAFPAFIGYAEKAPAFGEPHWVASFAQFQDAFGGAGPDGFRLHEAMRAFYDNGGDDALVLAVGPYGDASTDPAPLLAGLDRIGRDDRPTLLLAPDALRLARADHRQVARAMLAQCAARGDRLAILDVHGGGDPSAWSVAASRPLVADFRATVAGQAGLGYGAAYYPWLLSPSRAAMPPSAAMAGLYRQVDRARGVWKPATNIAPAGAADVTIRYNDEDQAGLNQPPDGLSINAIRTFAGQGIRIWGARTLAGNDSEYRYVSVRRTKMWIEQSVRQGLQPLIFEPNAAPAWVKAQMLVENFMTDLWRRGAFQGSTPDKAFYVSVGLGRTMTAMDIRDGVMRVEIGFAAVRPAEFVILRIQLPMPPPD